MKKFLISLLIISIIGLFASGAADAVRIWNPLSSNNFYQLVQRISVGISGVIGALSVIILTIGGIYFLFSAGNPEKIKRAKDYITYAIIGIVIAISAQAIVNIVLEILGTR